MRRHDPAVGRQVRLAWERFNSEPHDPVPVRAPVLASWRRSRLCGVPPDVLAVPHDEETDVESRFRWAAQPVLEDLAERLHGTANAVLLADSKARMVSRWVLDASLRRILDEDFVIERFCFGEEHVGTNGLGCPVEERKPFVVAGPEHYKEAFHHWTCVGAPVLHPISRQVEGIIDISCLYKDTNDLILPLVLDAVRHVEERLFFDASRAEQALLRHYLPAARGSTRAVTALNEKTIITNPLAARLLRDVDQGALWERAAQAVADRAERIDEFPVTPEKTLQVHCTPIVDGTKLVGALLEFSRIAPQRRKNVRRRIGKPVLDDLAGTSRTWRTVCDETLRRVKAGLPLLVVGEPGVGKLSLIKGACGRVLPGVELEVIDCAEEPVEGSAVWTGRARRLLSSCPAVVLRHLEALGPESAGALAVIVDERLAEGRVALCATLTATTHAPPEPSTFIERLAAGRVELPPLRQRPEDIPELVSALLRRHGGGHQIRISSEAMQLLMRGVWRHNIRQLENALRAALCDWSGGELGIADLPREVKRQATRRTLSVMEQIELDAILAALEQAGENRTRAAASLGISRATLHRRLKAYGLELDRSAF